MRFQHCAALLALALSSAASIAPVTAQQAAKHDPGSFTIAVIPDTQNYLDYAHQTEAGFPFDAREIFYDQMAYIARNAQSEGGEIAFAVGVGDVWQHATGRMDDAHARMGLKAIPNKLADSILAPDQRAVTVEMPIARKGYGMIAGKLPFAVVPGNHDYDANWSDSRFPPAEDYRNPGASKYPYGQLHYGGLANFNAVFGKDSTFFKGKPWYVGSYNGGANSAALLTAGGYRFLHIGLEMAPADDVLAWAETQMKAHPGLPTIITVHDHLSPAGKREPVSAVDFKAVHPEHNNAEDLWAKFLSRHDQIFLVLSGHQHGQAHRVDKNAMGHDVHQVLADYQDRHQSLIQAAPGVKPRPGLGIGDGWLRLMRFELGGAAPRIVVSTYSTLYKSNAAQLPTYSAFYKAKEKPELSDAAFVREEEFTLPLDGFASRFARARTK
ncbi:metallophosphoesterase [Sphingomonas sp. NPDC092331]|jgi:Calcineurin-like phosphoesterase|uniref:metallophosphoesterase n=1 Tax=unclassified Sphingomonas TaxID=196159 RepID=UPI0029ECD973|nr:metallophosphoesterase [Pseudomonadota bacterium]